MHGQWTECVPMHCRGWVRFYTRPGGGARRCVTAMRECTLAQALFVAFQAMANFVKGVRVHVKIDVGIEEIPKGTSCEFCVIILGRA